MLRYFACLCISLTCAAQAVEIPSFEKHDLSSSACPRSILDNSQACSQYFRKGDFSVANRETALGLTDDADLYEIRPSSAGLTLSPLGASVDLSVVSPQYRVSTTLTTTMGFNLSTGAYGFLRYDTRTNLNSTYIPHPISARFSVQGGLWPFDPHLATYRTKAFGLKNIFSVQVQKEDLLLTAALETGLLQLAASDDGFLFDGRSEFIAARQTTDAWGYKISGWRAALVGIWSAAEDAPSPGLWGEGTYIVPLDTAWRLDGNIRTGYRPAWPVPITVDSEVAALTSVGVSRSLALDIILINQIATLERLTVEPRARIWVDRKVHYGVDTTFSIDTTLAANSAVTFSATVGYAQHFWYRFGLRVTP